MSASSAALHTREEAARLLGFRPEDVSARVARGELRSVHVDSENDGDDGLRIPASAIAEYRALVFSERLERLPSRGGMSRDALHGLAWRTSAPGEARWEQ